MQSRSLLEQNKRLVGVLLTVCCLLMVPFVAMQFTQEVKWDETDFIVAGILLFGTGLLFELAMRRGGNTAYRAGASLALFTGLVLIWMNLAVGLIGNEGNPANLLYIGVLATAIIGSGIGHFKARAMARAMFAAAVVQLLVPIIAMIIWRPEVNAGMIGVVFLNAVFALLWAGSGFLLRNAAHQQGSA